MAEVKDRLLAAKSAIRDNFNRGASSYAGFEARNRFFDGLLTDLLALNPLKPGSRVLDVGCGSGASLAGLRRASAPGGFVLGIDISLEMLKLAAADLPPDAAVALLDGCDFAGALATRFDAVVYNAALFLLPDAEASLKAAKEALNPGGVVLASSLDRVTVNGVAVPELLEAQGHQAGRHSLSPWHKVRPLMEELFEELICVEVQREMPLELFTGFYTLLPMSAGLLPRLPYPERVRIIEEFGKKLQEEGKTPVQTWVLSRAGKTA